MPSLRTGLSSGTIARPRPGLKSKLVGTQFDPEVVKVFLSMDEKIWPDLRKEVDGQVQRFAYSTTAAKGSM